MIWWCWFTHLQHGVPATIIKARRICVHIMIHKLLWKNMEDIPRFPGPQGAPQRQHLREHQIRPRFKQNYCDAYAPEHQHTASILIVPQTPALSVHLGGRQENYTHSDSSSRTKFKPHVLRMHETWIPFLPMPDCTSYETSILMHLLMHGQTSKASGKLRKYHPQLLHERRCGRIWQAWGAFCNWAQPLSGYWSTFGVFQSACRRRSSQNSILEKFCGIILAVVSSIFWKQQLMLMFYCRVWFWATNQCIYCLQCCSKSFSFYFKRATYEIFETTRQVKMLVEGSTMFTSFRE